MFIIEYKGYNICVFQKSMNTYIGIIEKNNLQLAFEYPMVSVYPRHTEENIKHIVEDLVNRGELELL